MTQLERNLLAFIRSKLMKKNFRENDRQDAVEAIELFLQLQADHPQEK